MRLILLFIFIAYCYCNEIEELEAEIFIKQHEENYGKIANKQVIAEWAYTTNISEYTERVKLNVNKEAADFSKEFWKQQQKYNWRNFQNDDLKRRFKLSSVLGVAALPDDKFLKYEETVNSMQSAWNKARICDYFDKDKCNLSLRPEITDIFTKSRNENELKHSWVEFRRSTSNLTKNLYTEYVKLSNEAAKANNFSNAAEMWLRGYEADDFREQLNKLWDEIKPLYLQLHAYVRRSLREKYGNNIVSSRGPIPGHLLGHIHSQTWSEIAPLMLPYPNASTTDVTNNLIKQGYTADKIFKAADEFFTSLGLSSVPESFWEKSELVKPTDGREFECQASAWDFYDGKDFRIKQCTRVTQDQFHTVHHEMGHVQYFIQYKDQPITYRAGANPGFHEAVGDVIALSVSSPKHLRTVGLLEDAGENVEEYKKTSLNHLFSVALDKLAFIPSSFMMDTWRWDVFEEKIIPSEYNCHWVKLIEDFQGVESPVDRNANDFDPGSKYHIVASVPYIRYYVSFIIQFQFHRALCNAAGHTGPLHECDIYRSKEAGKLLGDMLKLGASKPWPDAMQLITGQRFMDATALREYFAPLEQWLISKNNDSNEYLGWEPSTKRCIS